MKQDYILSICMMVKDEEKNLGRCLDSLKPLLEKGDVELIIVDTGSSDKTPDIAKKYTDKVYYHPWNNDFSGMRNITISYATGTYILIMDADEVLNDPLLLYEYMNDASLRSYNTYLLKIKNYSTMGSFTIVAQERVFRNDGEFRYAGSVHNQARFKKPILGTDIYIDHYGYLFQDDELREKKFIRTAGILRKELEKNPGNPYYRFQLARSFSAHGDLKEAIEEIRRAYGLIAGNTSAMKTFCCIYGSYSMMSYESGEFEEAIKVCEEGLEIKPENLDLYFVMAMSYARLDKKAESMDAYGKYLDLVNKYDKLDISMDRSMEMCYTGPCHRDMALIFIANELMAQGKYGQAKEYITQIKDDKTRLSLLSKVLLKLKEFGSLAVIYLQHLDNKQITKSIADIIEAEKINLNTVEKKKIEEAFSSGGEDAYLLLNRVRRAEGDEKLMLMKKALKLVDFCELPDYYADMLSCINVNTRQTVSVLKRLSKTRIKQYARRLMDYHPGLNRFIEEFLLGEQVRSSDYHSLRVYISIAYTYLYVKAEKWKNLIHNLPESYNSIFKLYIKRGVEYISLLYDTERMRLYYNTLEDQEDRFLIALGYATEAVGKGDYRTGIKYFREAARINPYLACYMSFYKDELFSGINAADGGADCSDSVDFNSGVKNISDAAQPKAVDNTVIDPGKSIVINTEENSGNTSNKNLSNNSICNNKNLKVLHGTVEIANQMHTLAEGLKDLEIQTDTYNYYPSYLGYKSDYVYDVYAVQDKEKMRLEVKNIVQGAIKKYDIFHFHYGTSLAPDNSDLPVLKDSGKKVFMHHWGSDVRLYSKAVKLSNYVKVKTMDEDAIKRMMEHFSKYADGCIVGDYELNEYVKEYYEKVYIIPAAINVNDFICGELRDNLKPLVVHAPTSPAIKGTEYILKAVEELKGKYDFEFVLVKNMPNERAKAIYRQADIIVDQLMIGCYGVFAIESMAMGKPVISWISEFMREKYPKDLPIIPANPDNIKQQLEILLKDKQLRKDLGLKGRAYVEKYHDANHICQKLLEIYNN